MNEAEKESQRLYQLFIWHAQGKRLVERYCPNCGPMPHLEEPIEDRKRYTCIQCNFVTSTTGKEQHENN